MNESEISQYITDTFAGVDVVIDPVNRFFFYNPDPTIPPDHRFPFVTLVTDDSNDDFSNLNRESVFRLNMGISKATYAALFGSPRLPEYGASAAESDPQEGDYDFTALDQVMPHPVYGRMYWACILNPSAATFETQVRPLLAEAYDLAVSKYRR